MNSIRLWYIYTKIELKKWSEYKLDFLFISLASMINVLIGIFNIHIVFSKTEKILEWTEYEVIWMLGYYMLVECFFHTFFINCFDISSWIYNGRLDMLKTRPRSVIFQLLFSDRYNTEYPIDIFIGSIVLLCWSSSKLIYEWTPMKIGLFVLAIFFSVIIYSCLIFIISSISFWTIKSNYLVEFILELEEINQYPIAAYGNVVMMVLTYAIPIAFVSFYPCQYFLGHQEYCKFASFMPVIAIILLVLSVIVWKLGISKYESPNS